MALLKAIPPIATDVTIEWSVRLSVCLSVCLYVCMYVCMYVYVCVVCVYVCVSSVTFVHPAEAVGRNEMPFGRDTRVVPSNIVLDRNSRSPTGREDL